MAIDTVLIVLSILRVIMVFFYCCSNIIAVVPNGILVLLMIGPTWSLLDKMAGYVDLSNKD